MKLSAPELFSLSKRSFCALIRQCALVGLLSAFLAFSSYSEAITYGPKTGGAPNHQIGGPSHSGNTVKRVYRPSPTPPRPTPPPPHPPRPPRPPHPVPPPPPQPYYPYYPYNPYNPYNPYDPYYRPYNYYVPHTTTNPDTYGFGPAATMRFMGVTPNNANTGKRTNSSAAKTISELEQANQQLEDSLRQQQNQADSQKTSAAWKSVGAGDAMFANASYQAAEKNYRNAARQMPELTDAYVKQAVSQYAQGNYSDAVDSIKSGLESNLGWQNQDITLDELYGADNANRQKHIQNLADELKKNPDSPDLHFLAGVVLSLNGKDAAAKTHFDKAIKADRSWKMYVNPFVK